MVKKKTSEQNHSKPVDHSQNIENKDNSEIKADITAETGTEETAETDQQPAEKSVTEEISFDEKVAEMQDKYLRLSAEFDNYRRRTLREKMELSKYATENLFLSMLPLMDDFDRALSHMGEGTECTAVKEGIDLIYVKFTEFLKQNGVREIESLDREFNVDLHHAVAKVPAVEEEKKGKIIEVVQKGYYLQDKVIRHAKVVVGE